ncbi:MAG: aromatic ring-hydroxylating dioxygenase subunit alpha [Acidobacteriota bacterium]|nr:aromatic ring-hydroxylating dioxygenase subunit alpha [Acidobacteriota bacterium]
MTADVHHSLADPMLLTQWFAIAWSSEVPAGAVLARRFMARDVVLWRSAERLVCWRDLCIHRGAKLSLGTPRQRPGQSECLVCPYHAWEYAPSGQCVHIPAQPHLPPPTKARAESYTVCERYGVIWVCLGEPAAGLPEFPPPVPGMPEGTLRIVHAGPYRFRAKGPRVIENVFDVAHLGYVHAGMLGDPDRLEINDYDVTIGPQGPEASSIQIWQPDPDGTGRAALVDYHYWTRGPLTGGLIKRHGDEIFGILAQVVPIDEEVCESRLIMVLDRDASAAVSDQELIRFQDTVTAQDVVIVESQRPELLPLDLQAELHLRSDRLAIAYRRWLRDIGFTYGTA